MIHEPSFSASQLRDLAEAIAVAEAAHRQDIPLREDFKHVPVKCACGVQYETGSEWEQSKAHLREVAAQAVLATLHRPCESCFGSGQWHRLRSEFECPDCDGQGRTLTPLPAMVFQAHDGEPWLVSPFEVREGEYSTWVQVQRDF